jgi:hypothetical protein
MRRAPFQRRLAAQAFDAGRFRRPRRAADFRMRPPVPHAGLKFPRNRPIYFPIHKRPVAHRSADDAIPHEPNLPMISSTSSPDRAARPEVIAASEQAAGRTPAARPDQVSTESAAFLEAALVRHGEIRADVVARARGLAADPAYPPVEISRHVAGQILSAADLSEDES